MASHSLPRAPRTPEPMAKDEEEPMAAPSPPRPRLKLKRRNVSNLLSAPTQPSPHFLASVEAADVPIPSIEEPEIAPDDSDMTGSFDGMNMAMSHFGHDGAMDLSLLRGRQFTVPKTPAPDVVTSPSSPTRYHNWSTGSSFSSSTESSSPEPDYSSSRPSTSRSTYTNSSLFSRLSHFSDDCISPDSEDAERKLVPDGGSFSSGLDASSSSKRNGRKAPWTKPMDAHLWATYMMYLQDPKVTPFRTGRGCIPPHGVCSRVSRQAKRSWKGTKPLNKANGAAVAAAAAAAAPAKSGSTTPTAEATSTFIAWPHSCGATRAHLRELCRLKAAAPGCGLGLRYLSRSPTPFNQVVNRHWNRRSTPGRTGSAFATQDIAMSLTVSTSDAMHPHGPLAQLTSSSAAEATPLDIFANKTPTFPPTAPSAAAPAPVPAPVPAEQQQPAPSAEAERSFSERPARLGSPFTAAKSYGPSSSTSLAAVLGLTGPRQPHTVGPRRPLQSPVRLGRWGTSKRGVTKASHESRKRPSLGSDLWVDPTSSSGKSDQKMADFDLRAYLNDAEKFETEFSSTSSTRHDELFIPRTAGPLGGSLGSAVGQYHSQQLLASAAATAPEPVPAQQQLAQPMVADQPPPPPRLGSPFSVSSTSFSFPNRFFQPSSMDPAEPLMGRGRPFATVQQPQQQPAAAIEQLTSATAAAPARSNLSQRLAYIDRRLKEFRERGVNRRRSESPF